MATFLKLHSCALRVGDTVVAECGGPLAKIESAVEVIGGRPVAVIVLIDHGQRLRRIALDPRQLRLCLRRRPAALPAFAPGDPARLVRGGWPLTVITPAVLHEGRICAEVAWRGPRGAVRIEAVDLRLLERPRPAAHQGV